jgi:hypothetical protein
MTYSSQPSKLPFQFPMWRRGRILVQDADLHPAPHRMPDLCRSAQRETDLFPLPRRILTTVPDDQIALKDIK